MRFPSPPASGSMASSSTRTHPVGRPAGHLPELYGYYSYYLTSTDNAFLDRRQPSFSTRIDELNSFCCLQVVCGDFWVVCSCRQPLSAADNLQTTSSLPVTSCKGLSAVKKSENELTESCQLDCIFVVCGGKMLSAVDCG